MKQFFTVLSVLFLLLVPFINSAFSQGQLIDVIYLKNGSVMKGTILERIPNESIKIQTADGNIFVYKYDAIERVEKQLLNQEASVPEVQYKDRIGLTLGAGSGFDSAPVIQLTDGSEASISFGGGTMFQIEFGHEFSRNFDLAIDVGGQFGSLDKTVSNGSMSFDRSVLSLTPSYILPLGRGDKYRLKFGGGIDFLYNDELNFDLSQMSGGFKDDWKYNSAFGEHLTVIIEMKIPERFSISAGLKWQNASYTFESGGHSYPISSDLKSPNGSGIDFFIGGFYHVDWIP